MLAIRHLQSSHALMRLQALPERLLDTNRIRAAPLTARPRLRWAPAPSSASQSTTCIDERDGKDRNREKAHRETGKRGAGAKLARRPAALLTRT